MPLDPQTRVLLQQMEKANLTPYEAMTPQESRRQMALGSCFLERPPEVASWEDREIPGPASRLRIRHYRPAADFGDVVVLQTEIGIWSEKTNAKQWGVDWQFTIGDARRKLKRLYPGIKA